MLEATVFDNYFFNIIFLVNSVNILLQYRVAFSVSIKLQWCAFDVNGADPLCNPTQDFGISSDDAHNHKIYVGSHIVVYIALFVCIIFTYKTALR
jgi:hypothetical protein